MTPLPPSQTGTPRQSERSRDTGVRPLVRLQARPLLRVTAVIMALAAFGLLGGLLLSHSSRHTGQDALVTALVSAAAVIGAITGFRTTRTVLTTIRAGATRRQALGALGVIALCLTVVQVPVSALLVVTAPQTTHAWTQALASSCESVLRFELWALGAIMAGMALALLSERLHDAAPAIMATMVIAGSFHTLGFGALDTVADVLRFMMPALLRLRPLPDGVDGLGWALVVGPLLVTGLMLRWEPGTSRP